jgi:hypothetical protein
LKIGLALEGMITNIEREFEVWKQRSQGGASSYLDPKVVRDETFWATQKAQYNLSKLNDLGMIYVLTERPPSLLLATRSWLRRNGLGVQDEHIIMRSSGRLKRYDCRLHDLDYFVDSERDVLLSFKHDKCVPVSIGEQIAPWIQNYETLEALELGPDLREWKKWNDETMPEDGEHEHL